MNFEESYDNLIEYNGLEQKVATLGIVNPEMNQFMIYLKQDIEEVKRRAENPIRSSEAQAFYKHIVGINSYIWETKQKDPSYVFDNVPEVEGLLAKVIALNTQDPDILAIMDTITKDIKKIVGTRSGLEVAEKYQERLTSLGIGVTIEPEEKVK